MRCQHRPFASGRTMAVRACPTGSTPTPRSSPARLDRIFGASDWLYRLPRGRDPQPRRLQAQPAWHARGRSRSAARDGAINVLVNRCAHRSMQFCTANRGSAKEFVCPYHQWTYDLAGNLLGVPFRRGYRGQGGMPADFRPEEHGLQRLAVTDAPRRGVRQLRRTQRVAGDLSRRRACWATSTACSTAASSSCSATCASASPATGS